MAKPARDRGIRRSTARAGLVVTLACLSLPVLAATGVGLDKCDETADRSALLNSASATDELTVVRSESLLEAMDKSESDIALAQEQALRSAALNDALEQRLRQRSELSTQPSSAEDGVPSVETRLPGVSATESLLFRREMFRTDI